jgi:hypothetical protein
MQVLSVIAVFTNVGIVFYTNDWFGKKPNAAADFIMFPC